VRSFRNLPQLIDPQGLLNLPDENPQVKQRVFCGSETPAKRLMRSSLLNHTAAASPFSADSGVAVNLVLETQNIIRSFRQLSEVDDDIARGAYPLVSGFWQAQQPGDLGKFSGCRNVKSETDS